MPKIFEHPTPSHLISVQRYLKKLNKRGKLANDKYDKIRPKSAKLAWAHGLPKIHKLFKNIPSFCPIIDTTGTTHYSVGKELSELLNPLTYNNCSFKDSFDAATRISRILRQIRENDDYMFISLDVASLFTNVPLKKRSILSLNASTMRSKFQHHYPNVHVISLLYILVKILGFFFQQQNV